MSSFYNLILSYRLDPRKKYFISRHDIDSDNETAKRMFEEEKKHSIKASYYFRKRTLDIELMKEIDKFGSEASYHYEEIATYCKKIE